MKPLELNITQKLPDAKVLFLATLSNGESILEGKDDWAWIDGKPSPWNRLVRYTAENNIGITSLSLILPNGKAITLPPISKKSKFVGYAGQKPEDTPIDFEVKRFLARDIDVGVKDKKTSVEGIAIADFYTIAEAIYADHVLQIWVNELGDNHSFIVSKMKGGTK